MRGHNWFPILFVDVTARNLKSDMVAGRSGIQKSAKAGRARAFTVNSGNKAVGGDNLSAPISYRQD